jgi:hypothetical protein
MATITPIVDREDGTQENTPKESTIAVFVVPGSDYANSMTLYISWASDRSSDRYYPL